jgi:hypothetical protein
VSLIVWFSQVHNCLALLEGLLADSAAIDEVPDRLVLERYSLHSSTHPPPRTRARPATLPEWRRSRRHEFRDIFYSMTQKRSTRYVLFSLAWAFTGMMDAADRRRVGTRMAELSANVPPGTARGDILEYLLVDGPQKSSRDRQAPCPHRPLA